MKAILRLDKYLADLGCGTRSQVRQLVKKGQVRVNGETVKQADRKVDARLDRVELEGRVLQYRNHKYILFHKPAGCVSATEDARDKTVLDYLPVELQKDLFPVGRLDKDTEGLLLLTDDGELAHRLLSPKKHVDKTYYAHILGKVTWEDQEAFSHGVDIQDGKLTLPARLEILEAGLPGESQSEESRILLTVQEGRFHQVKRMFRARGKEVLYLKRISMGPLYLEEELRPGEFRELTQKELEALEIKR